MLVRRRRKLSRGVLWRRKREENICARDRSKREASERGVGKNAHQFSYEPESGALTRGTASDVNGRVCRLMNKVTCQRQLSKLYISESLASQINMWDLVLVDIK